MSAYEYTEELRRRGLLGEKLLGKLQEKATDPERPLSARSVAKFLVQKQHLSQQQATDALNALVVQGVDIDEATVPTGDSILEVVPIEDDAEDSENSSIFAPFVTGRSGAANPPADDPDGDADELSLSPLADVILDPVEATATPAATTPPPRKESVPPKAPRRESRPPEIETFEPEPIPAATRSSIDDLPVGLSTIKSSSAARRTKFSKGSSKKRAKPVTRANPWDSPLMLIGGGALVLLILGGIAIAFVLRQRNVDDQLAQAKKAADSGAYTQSIEIYENFIASYPTHHERSAAKVNLALVKLRRDTESGDLKRALATAREELAAVEGEEKFAEIASNELKALLPRIAAGLAERAEASTKPDEAHELIERSNDAIALASNTRYIPASQADPGKLDEVRATIARVERREQSQSDLRQAVTDIDKALEAGDTNAAYALRRRLIDRHPELKTDAGLIALVDKTTAAERARTKWVAEQKPAETTERPNPWLTALATAVRSPGAPAANSAGGAVCVRIESAAYGLEVASGRLLWRRPMGLLAPTAPTEAPIRVGNDVVLIDATDQSLVRLDAATGELRWRQVIGEPFAPPLVVGERAFLAAASGHLYAVDLNSGARAGYVEFPQPLAAPPTVDRQGRRMYVVGQHSSITCLSLADMSCLGVYFTGHAAGSVAVAPAAVQNMIALLENDGIETCRLRMFALNDEGLVAGPVTDRRLAGLAARPPQTVGRRLIVVTDRGELDVFDVGVGEGDKALSLVATRDATSKTPATRHVIIADGNLWIGENQLTKHAILPTGNKLPVIPIDNDYTGAIFDHPLQMVGSTLVQVHRPKGRPGFVVAGMDAAKGRVLWETTLAVPPAGPPFVDPAAKTLLAASANGAVFMFDSAAMRSRVLDQPLAAPPVAGPVTITTGVDLGRGRAAYSAANGDRLLLVDSSQGTRATQWVSLPGRLACPLSRFADGLLAPLSLGQVLYLNPADGTPLAAPFQPMLEAGATIPYLPPAVAEGAANQFVICDGRDKIYLVSLVAQPRPHLQSAAEAAVGPDPLASPLIFAGDQAVAATRHGRLLKYRLPSLEPAGETKLSAPVVWGPFPTAQGVLLATADNQMSLVSPDGSVAWSSPVEHGDLAGPPLFVDGGIVVAYRDGNVERRAIADGRPAATANVAHSLAAGPVDFLGRVVLVAQDGTILVINQP